VQSYNRPKLYRADVCDEQLKLISNTNFNETLISAVILLFYCQLHYTACTYINSPTVF